MIANFLIPKGAAAPWLELQIRKDGILPINGMAPAYGCADKVEDPALVKLKDAEGQPLYTDIKFQLWRCGRTPIQIETFGTVEVSEDGYTVRYKWDSRDTATAGCYYGRFVITMKDNWGRLVFPYMLESLSIEITK